MEPISDSFKSSTTCRGDEVEAVELLDECWFFENLFRRQTRMSRSCSDPYPSSKSIDDTFEQIQKSNESSVGSINVATEGALVRHNIHRTPSLPPSIGREEVVKEKEAVRRTSKLIRQGSLCTPGVLSPLRTEEVVQEKEAVRRMNKLTRQGSLCSSNVLPPLQTEEVAQEEGSVRRTNKLTRHGSLCSSNVLPLVRTSKMTTPSPGLPKHQVRRESKTDSTTERKKSTSLTKGVIGRSLSQKVSTKSLSRNLSSKSPSELECEEVQGFKDLGFVFDKEVLNPSVINLLPGLQSNKPVDHNDNNKVRKPYLSEAWLVQNSTPSVPDWITGRSGGDVKAQLKFWARAVASNVHQEC